MRHDATTIEQLKADVDEEVRSTHKQGYMNKYPEDSLHEIADSHVPIYYSTLTEMLAGDGSLAYVEDEGLCDPTKGVHHMIQVAIYEHLLQQAHETWQAIQEEE